ncbi:hypothetical protein [Tautonia plasticadhaerens]|uniref:DUF3352 domain-containing protein n=1 Tax=Tautonia plasticadhaerens TaxID=2527974 RepID=A0A518HB49_9BACT|nr:hypothetical protein [Tautonia plasticadhaerens]QDV38037.1 hypothetical protein ElP_59850 [Tautonia plasticadhaerens]
MTCRRPSIRTRAVSGMLLALFLTSPAVSSSESADELMGRVPPDASLVLELEGLGPRLEALVDSGLGEGLAASRLVRDWLASDEGATLRRAKRDVEVALGAPLVEIADRLLGRAAVLSLHLPEGEAPEQARGLLQTVVADRDLLSRFIGAANAAERASGALLAVEEREHGGVSYSIRDFGDGRPDEAYAMLDDGTFVWTNARRLMTEVIDRVGLETREELLDDPALARVRSAMPGGAMARAFVAPRLIARLAASDPNSPKLDDLPAPVAEYLGAIDALGAALEWRDGPVLHVIEALDPDRLPDPVRSWASRSGDAGPILGLIPPSALLAAAGHVDLPALHDLIVASVPEEDRGGVEALTGVARGLLLGKDPRSEILPAIGPGVVGWVDTPADSRPIGESPAVLVASVGDPAAAEALDNALRTALAFLSLDDDGGRRFRLSVEGRDGARVTALISEAGEGAGRVRFAFAVARGLIVVGTDADAVASVLSDRGAGESRTRPAALVARDRLFPDASTFAYLDLDAVRLLADSRRAELVELLEDESDGEDLSRVLDLLGLFRGVYATSSLAEDGSMAHRRLGLIVAEPGGQ